MGPVALLARVFGGCSYGRDTLVDLSARYFWPLELSNTFLGVGNASALLFGLTCICSVLAYCYRTSTDAGQRRRIRWYAAGMALGLSTEIVIGCLQVLSLAQHRPEDILRRLIGTIKDLDSVDQVSKVVSNELNSAPTTTSTRLIITELCLTTSRSYRSG